MKNNSLIDKWGEKTLASGWTALPLIILTEQKKLNLNPTGLNVLLHLLSQWWEKEKMPYPSQISIAKKMGVSPRTVQREIAKMKKNGLLKTKRTPFNDPKYLGRNIYDLTPLILLLEDLILEKK